MTIYLIFKSYTMTAKEALNNSGIYSANKNTWTFGRMLQAMEEYASSRSVVGWVRASERLPEDKGWYCLKNISPDGFHWYDGITFVFNNKPMEGFHDNVLWLDESPSEQSGQMREALAEVTEALNLVRLHMPIPDVALRIAIDKSLETGRTALDSVPGDGGDGAHLEIDLMNEIADAVTVIDVSGKIKLNYQKVISAVNYYTFNRK